jgi:hypothetical protein
MIGPDNGSASDPVDRMYGWVDQEVYIATISRKAPNQWRTSTLKLSNKRETGLEPATTYLEGRRSTS